MRWLFQWSPLLFANSWTPDPYDGCGALESLLIFAKRLPKLLTFREEIFLDELQIITLAAVGISSALVGSLLVLRRSTMLANSLAHTTLCGIVSAFLWDRYVGTGAQAPHGLLSLQTLWIAAGTSALFTSWCTDWVQNKLKLAQETSIALVFSTLFALGVLLVSMLARDAHIGLEVIMGNVDALMPQDAKISLIVALINVFLCGLFAKEHIAAAFDPQFAKSVGIKTRLLDYLLVMQTSLTMMSAFRSVGSFLVLAWISGLPILALMKAKSLFQLWFRASIMGLLLSVASVLTTRHLLSTQELSLSTSGMSVSLLALVQIGAMGVRGLRQRFGKTIKPSEPSPK